ncbi:GrpB family protein [Streptomyces sp. NPDC090075]|uniref:GrpB family protein n=1 Tax=Streptomyces sp. NPDC090075 TaxID=3365937 RepID=UPI0037FD38F3
MSEPGGIHVPQYDPRRPRQAAPAGDALRAAAPGLSAKIDHIGSTPVPGPAAKPAIDPTAAVHNLTHAAPHQRALAGLGLHPYNHATTDRLPYVRTDNDVRSHTPHVATPESRPTRNQRTFRDHPHTHPEDPTPYAQPKRATAAAGTAPGEYARAKTAPTQKPTDRARTQLGPPSLPAGEKQ